MAPAHTPAHHPRESTLSTDLLRPLAPGDEDPVIALLRAGIPLTLLMDLACEDPKSAEIYRSESASA